MSVLAYAVNLNSRLEAAFFCLRSAYALNCDRLRKIFRGCVSLRKPVEAKSTCLRRLIPSYLRKCVSIFLQKCESFEFFEIPMLRIDRIITKSGIRKVIRVES
jgi:hypothetical protein